MFFSHKPMSFLYATHIQQACKPLLGLTGVFETRLLLMVLEGAWAREHFREQLPRL